MKYRPLGRTGVQVSALCYGTMSFGWQADEALAGGLYGASRDAGINFFDTADVYSDGKAEEILGRLIADHRDQVVIATKAFYPMGSGVNDRGASRFHLVRAAEASLRRLGTDRLDLYYIHRFDDGADLEETLRGLELLVRQGKILYPAASNFAAWQIAKALGIAALRGWAPMVGLQPMYNLAKRQAEVEILPLAASESLAVMPYSPLGGGLLSGKYGVDQLPEEGRLVEVEMYSVRYQEQQNFEIASRFTALAAELGHHPASLAVAWVAAHPAVTAPIIGARTPEQLATALAAVDIDLDAGTYDRISAVSPEPPPATDRSDERTLGV